MARETRIEKDALGEMKVQKEALFGASTQRAVENFPVSGLRFPPSFIRALAEIKNACAKTNLSLKKLDSKNAKAIVEACEAIAEGKYYDQFVVDVFQTGSGTSTNMNFNEVAANLANLNLGSSLGSKKPVHPNDHVNLGQSSNDMIPTTIHVAAAYLVHSELLPNLAKLHSSLQKKSKAFSKLIKMGRTHLQDATPITLGQEFSGYAAQIELASERIESVLPRLCELAIGGTAVGTGINTHPKFAQKICEELKKEFKLPFKEARNHFAAQASVDTCVELSGALKTLAVSLSKIANDLRWLSSGPRSGLGEISLPKVQPGSSIMPGKVNPVMAEMVLQVAAHVQGSDVIIGIGGASGNFELNTMLPLVGYHLLTSIEYLSHATLLFTEKCIEGIEANEERLRELVERSLMLVTGLVPEIGYDEAAKIADDAFKNNLTLLEAASKSKKISREKAKILLNPASQLNSRA